MNPQSPQQPNYAQIALQQRQNGQQSTQPQQPTDLTQQPQQPDPGVLGQAQQQSQAREGKIQQEGQLGQQNQQNSMAAVSQAMAMLNPKENSNDPTANTMSRVGQAINPNQGWANLCEAYAEQQTLGHQGVYPTAIAAFKDQAIKGNINTSTTNIPKGAQIFFNATQDNGYNGHTMVSIGGGKFQGPLQNGNIGTFTLPEWEKYSGGQQYLGYTVPSK